MPALSEAEKARRALQRQRKKALAAEERALQRERKQQEWITNGSRLTWAELEAGAACKGCGEVVQDRQGGWGAILYMDEQKKAQWDALQARFAARHSECHEMRWSEAGSSTMHCGFCCPPPPLSPAHAAEIKQFLLNLRRPDPRELVTWRLSLTCDHAVDMTQHRSQDYCTASTRFCTACGQTRGVVSSEKITLEPEPDNSQLETELSAAQHDYDRAEKRAAAALRKVTKIKSQLDGH